MDGTQLLHIIKQSKKTDFKAIPAKTKSIAKQSFTLFKNVWNKGLITMLIFIGLLIPFWIVFTLLAFISVYMEASCDYCKENIPYLLLVYGMFITGFCIITTLATGLLASYYSMCHQEDTQQKGTNNHFHFFKSNYLSKTIKLGTITGIMGLLLVGIVQAINMLSVFRYAPILPLLPMFYGIVPLLFISVIYAFNPNLSVKSIVKVAFVLGNKHWWLSFVFVVLGLIINFIGLLLGGLGVLVTFPITILPLYFIYKEMVGFKDLIA